MRAVVCSEFGPFSQLALTDFPDPQPGPNDVLIDVVAAGVNFPDRLIVAGKYQMRPELPFVAGAEAAGVVSALGDNVSGVEPGDRVIALGRLYGAFAEKSIAPARTLLRMPDEMDFVTAAGFGLAYGTSYYALKQRAQLKTGETLLVLGAAGGVGLAAVQLGHAMGARVIAAASTQDKLDVARASGAAIGIDYSTESLKLRVKELTDGKGVDVVCDPVGGEFSEQALRATGWNGRMLVIGFAAGDIPKIPLNLPLLKNNSVVGVFWGAWAARDPAASLENYGELFRMYREGKIKPLVSQVFDLENFAGAFEAIEERRAQGKVILRVGES